METQHVSKSQWEHALLEHGTGVTVTQRAVWMSIAVHATYADGTGVWPSQGGVAKKLEVDRMTVNRAIKVGVETGWLTECGLHDSGTKIYRLTIPVGVDIPTTNEKQPMTDPAPAPKEAPAQPSPGSDDPAPVLARIEMAETLKELTKVFVDHRTVCMREPCSQAFKDKGRELKQEEQAAER